MPSPNGLIHVPGCPVAPIAVLVKSGDMSRDLDHALRVGELAAAREVLHIFAHSLRVGDVLLSQRPYPDIEVAELPGASGPGWYLYVSGWARRAGERRDQRISFDLLCCELVTVERQCAEGERVEP